MPKITDRKREFDQARRTALREIMGRDNISRPQQIAEAIRISEGRYPRPTPTHREHAATICLALAPPSAKPLLCALLEMDRDVDHHIIQIVAKARELGFLEDNGRHASEYTRTLKYWALNTMPGVVLFDDRSGKFMLSPDVTI